jgi:hypothetical protein
LRQKEFKEICWLSKCSNRGLNVPKIHVEKEGNPEQLLAIGILWTNQSPEEDFQRTIAEKVV